MANKGLFASAIAKLMPAADTLGTAKNAPAYTMGPSTESSLANAQPARWPITSTAPAGHAAADVLGGAPPRPYFIGAGGGLYPRSGAMKDVPALLNGLADGCRSDLAGRSVRPGDRQWPHAAQLRGHFPEPGGTFLARLAAEAAGFKGWLERADAAAYGGDDGQDPSPWRISSAWFTLNPPMRHLARLYKLA